VWGADHAGVRVSPINPFNDMQDSDPQTTFDYVASRLAGCSLAYLHIYQAGTDPFDWQRLLRIFGGTFIVNNGYDRAKAEAALESGAADLVAFGVSFLANPDLVERLRRNAPLNKANHATFLRNELAAQRTQVLALHMSFVDTDLVRAMDAPKASPQEIVKRALDALESGLEEVLADEPTRLVKAGLSAPRPSYLPQRA
jgi:hypothetical protein